MSPESLLESPGIAESAELSALVFAVDPGFRRGGGMGIR
jgi:hypothetical protein